MDFSANPYAETSFDFYDTQLLNIVEAGDRHVHNFFRTLALCHTVMPEVDEEGKAPMATSEKEIKTHKRLKMNSF